jgi:hypothetical protein
MMTRLLRVAFALAVSANAFAAPPSTSQPLDRARLPSGLRDAPLNRLSTGALMMLDQGGDLVLPPRTANTAAETSSDVSAAAAGATLDPRVGPNVRLGDDPATLDNANCGSQCAPHAQAEPDITRSRTNLDLLVATFQEGRFATGGSLDCGYSVSRDGGLTWTRALLPGVTQLFGGPYYRATDPVVGIDLQNNVYINMDAATDTSFDHGDIIVSRSTDAGATFQAPVVVYSPGATGYFPDKNWLTVNTFSRPPSAGRVLVTFTLFTTGSNSPLVAYYSDDQGVTWNPSNGLGFITPANSSMQGSQPVFLPNGNAAVVYWNFGSNTSPGERLEVITSSDGGVTFGTAHRIANATEWVEPVIRSGTFLPNATTDRTTNSIYVVYQALFQNSPRIMFTKSSDGGATWTSPIAISDNPAGLGVFNPAIAASPDGQTLTAAFYDHRVSGNNGTIVDMFEAQSFDGGATWQPNIRLTSVSTDASLAPQSVDPDSNTARGYMLGDYLGVADPATRNIPAVPVFVDTRTGNPDPFVARIGVAPQFDFTSWQAARLSYAQTEAPQYGLRQLNISTRDLVGVDDGVMIGGFIVTGPAGSSKKVMIRGLGPSLASSGVPNTLADPYLELHEPDNTVLTNDNWQSANNTADIPSGFQPSDSRESVIVATLAAQPNGSNYTAILKGAHAETGNGLLELYDLDSSGAAQFANISPRGVVSTGDNVLIGGFIVGGGTAPSATGSARIVVRAIGPSLPNGPSISPLQDPTLELHDVNGTALLFDDNWKDSQQAEIQATGLAPSDARESAMVALLPPGNYTAILRGKNNTTGLALVEAYNLQ